MSTKLYRFEWGCGRMGDVEGVFVAEEAAVEAALDKDVNFGEILGKHSEVDGLLEEVDLAVVDATPEFVEEFARLFPNGLGYNPLEYLEEEA